MACAVGATMPNLPRWLSEASKQAMGNEPGLDVWMQAMTIIASHRALAHVAQLWISICERQPKEELRVDAHWDLHSQESASSEPQELAIVAEHETNVVSAADYTSVVPAQAPEKKKLRWAFSKVGQARSANEIADEEELSEDGTQVTRTRSVINRVSSRFSMRKEKSIKIFAEESTFGQIVKSQYFELSTLAVTILNVIWIGIDIDYNKEDNIRKADAIFIAAEFSFCILFSLELIFRALAFKRISYCIKDSWFVFDFCLVVLMVTETMLLPFVLNLDDLGPLGILRILRLLRLTRMVRIVRALPELMVFLKSMIFASRSVCTTGILIIVLIYCFSIFFVEFCGNSTWCRNEEECTQNIYPLRDYFVDIQTAMITLFVQGTLLDECDGLIKDLRDSSGLLLLIFIAFVCISAFTVLNMLIGVLCDQIVETSADEKKKLVLHRVQETFTEVFRKMDRDCDGVISEEEFHLMQDTSVVQSALRELGVEPRHLWALQDSIFNEFGDGENKELSFQKFLDILCHLRPETKASVLDVADLRMQLRDLEKRMQQMISKSTHEIVALHSSKPLLRPAVKQINADNSVPPVWSYPKEATLNASDLPPDVSKSAKVAMGLSDMELVDADEDDALPGVPAHRFAASIR